MSRSLRARPDELAAVALAGVGTVVGFATWGALGAVATALVLGSLAYAMFNYPF